ncbi:MAG: DUF2235 domain-containing protein [Gammaproteobacteria bacterium]|nr:DUF2235 domain-containing protein [Gammaproteobacteria bacterium]
MSQFGEGGYSAAPDEVEEKQEETKKIRVRISLFFDGTLNNRINIDQRIEDEKDPGTNKTYQRYKDGENSYEGEYTNIARMERYIDNAKDYQVTLSSYTEGAGTQDEGKDKLFGMALGKGSTGIFAKVEKGISDAVNEVELNVKTSQIIKLLTIDVFGFSRGAAGARNCIYEVLNTGKNPIKARIEEKGYDIKKVKVCFAGLYDTVASHGVIYKNDTTDLNLTAINRAKKVVQLAAAEEHRKKFNLTLIDSAGDKGRQFYLPGVHSDIGGGYRSAASGKAVEKDMGIYWTLNQQSAEQERQRLIDAGWYKPEEIEVIRVPSMDYSGLDDFYVEVTRKSVSNEYSRIPLHIMARFARESGVGIKGKLENTEKISGFLTKVQGKLNEYIKSIDRDSAPEHWHNNDSWLKKLRHDYLHFSAYLSIAHSPRFKNHRRVRKTFYG